MKDFEDWWATEPFGFDNPDTYNGIRDLLLKRENEIERLRKIIKEINDIKIKNKREILYLEDWVANKSYKKISGRSYVKVIKEFKRDLKN